jgi:hypothetical protein
VRKSLEIELKTSCLNKAKEDELLFVLLERDDAAAQTVEFWIDKRLSLGKNEINDPQIAEARQWIKEWHFGREQQKKQRLADAKAALRKHRDECKTSPDTPRRRYLAAAQDLALVIVDAYFDEHPDDEDEPIDIDYLKACGFFIADVCEARWINNGRNGLVLERLSTQFKRWTAKIEGRLIAHIETRRELRLLCELFRIPLTPPKR